MIAPVHPNSCPDKPERPSWLALVVAAGFFLVMFVVSVIGILLIPATQRIEGLLLILAAVVADCFLGGLLRVAETITHRLVTRQDALAGLLRRHYRIAANVLSALFVTPMLIAIIRILGLE